MSQLSLCGTWLILTNQQGGQRQRGRFLFYAHKYFFFRSGAQEKAWIRTTFMKNRLLLCNDKTDIQKVRLHHMNYCYQLCSVNLQEDHSLIKCSFKNMNTWVTLEPLCMCGRRAGLRDGSGRCGLCGWRSEVDQKTHSVLWFLLQPVKGSFNKRMTFFDVLICIWDFLPTGFWLVERESLDIWSRVFGKPLLYVCVNNASILFPVEVVLSKNVSPPNGRSKSIYCMSVIYFQMYPVIPNPDILCQLFTSKSLIACL